MSCESWWKDRDSGGSGGTTNRRTAGSMRDGSCESWWTLEGGMERLPMYKAREILRLRWVLGLGVRQAAASAGIGRSVVSKTSPRAETAGLNWGGGGGSDRRRARATAVGRPCAGRAEPDPLYVHTELRRQGVTLELLHLEYLREHPEGYRYTAYCDRYRAWQKRVGVWMRQVHVAGEKAFVDDSGRGRISSTP
jgi:hypothetical protein